MQTIQVSTFATTDIDTQVEYRGASISKVTPHIAKEVNSAAALCSKNRNRPYHYYIGFDGEIIAGLDERAFSQVSNNNENDNQAITILLSNSDTSKGWPVSEASLKALFELMADLSVRHNLALMYTGEADATVTTHDIFVNTDCPGPYLKSKLRLLCFALNNKLKGLPYVPQSDKGIFRVKMDERTPNVRAIHNTFEDALKQARKWKYNIYDRNGIEVYNYKFMHDEEILDSQDVIRVGDTVTSREVLCYGAPGSIVCCFKVRGIYRTYLPELGGYIPNKYISHVDPDEEKYVPGKTAFTLDEGVVEEVNEEYDKVKVHGVWVQRAPLLKKRN